MKKIIYNFLVLVLVMVSSCTKDNSVEPIFDKSINERAAELKSAYINVLSAPEYGWVGYYSPNPENGSYTLLLKFKPDGSVDMQSDYKQGANNAIITYRIDKTLKMELVFESHSVLHSIYEVGNNNNGGEYVLNILSAEENEIVLQSKTDNGYSEEPTELRLRKATADDWDVTPLYSSLDNLLGDGTKSVFRNVLINDVPVASFTFNESRVNATISYLEGGELVTVIAPMNVTPDGFSFINPLTIGGVTLSSFIYDADEDVFVDATSNAKILYDLVPAIPLVPYNFGAKDVLQNNKDESGKSSKAYNDFYAAFRESLLTQYGIEVNWYALVFLISNDPAKLYIGTNYGNITYDFTYEIKADGRVYFTLTGATNADAFWDTNLEPLVNILVGSTKGYYLRGTGGLLNFTNKTASLINADNPAFEINYWDYNL